MLFQDESSYANPGIYRQSLEEIMYTPIRKVEKKQFHDETLSSAKRVTTLLQKFESGKLDLSIDTEEIKDVKHHEDDILDGPVYPILFTPTPKPRTIRRGLRPKEATEYHDDKLVTEKKKECPVIVETPILRTINRQFSGVSFIETPFKLSRINLEGSAKRQEPYESRQKTKSTEVEDHTLVTKQEKESPVLVETPILRTLNRQFSGASYIETRYKLSRSNLEKSTELLEQYGSRQTSKSTGSSSGSSEASSSDSNDNRNDVNTETASDSFNTANRFYFSKFARAQVHHKFEMYFKWDSETLRSCAVTVSKLRFEILQKIPQCEKDERVIRMMKIYKKCSEGVNKEMDTLCCALFDLLDDVNDKRLSIHEEYVVEKYNKKIASFGSR
ncbi:Protein CBG05291 [Caenorhabditis briggsae]|uniref:Uncharacterized protein n=2 Tax=Caenorhabditis briggsae TaxID=6238 RepID=A0AAE8ZU53_CAEBR|nr:Protein CBG05291 [Caenorhabditis briggsae]ULT84236.1 hypothetical protein L3Y34_013113 [Caenorhabditis briggsae]CAP25807.2 Protein CBG05291 [Caenorhabditis briggsae]